MRKNRLSRYKQDRLIEHFVPESTARTAAKLFNVNKHNHINGIENFWNQAKRHMRKFNGIPAEHFSLFKKMRMAT